MFLPAFSGRFANWIAAQTASTGGDAHQHALLVADQTAGGKGVVVLHGDDLVIDGGVQHVRHKACADAWILCAPAVPLLSTGRKQAQQPPP